MPLLCGFFPLDPNRIGLDGTALLGPRPARCCDQQMGEELKQVGLTDLLTPDRLLMW